MSQEVADRSVSVVLLAGGVGKRMGASIPKQYLELCGMPIACHSLRTFANMPEVAEIVIVCNEDWRHIFKDQNHGGTAKIKWALPGTERQDSMSNGFDEADGATTLIAVHDSARPLIKAHDLRRCLEDAEQHGAAVLGVPVKPTIKEVGTDMMVERTLARSKLWDVQTPQARLTTQCDPQVQVIKPDLLREGIEAVNRDGLEVTDDVSIIEAIGKPVKMTHGSYTNIKVTTPDDMSVAERFLSETS